MAVITREMMAEVVAHEYDPLGRWLPKPKSALSESEVAVEVIGNSAVFRPAHMVAGQFYLAQINGKPYLYRKVSDVEVEIYGLAEDI